MRMPRRHRGWYGTLRIDRLLGFYRLYHLSPRSVFAVTPCHIGSNKRNARCAIIAPDLHECLILKERRLRRVSKDERSVTVSWFETAHRTAQSAARRAPPHHEG